MALVSRFPFSYSIECDDPHKKGCRNSTGKIKGGRATTSGEATLRGWAFTHVVLENILSKIWLCPACQASIKPQKIEEKILAQTGT